MHGAGGYKPPPNALPPPPPAAPVPVGQQPPVFLPQSIPSGSVPPSAAAAAAAAARGVVGSGVSVTLTPAPAAHSNQHAGFNMPGRTSAAPVHQQYQQLLQQYQHPAAPTAFLQQQQQQQQAQAAAAAAAAVEHQMDNEVKTYVSVKADPIEPTRIKYTCNACQFSPKNIGLLVDHINSVHLKRKTAPSAGMFAGAAAVAALAKQQPALAASMHQAKKSKSSSNHLLGQHRPSPKSINLYKCKQCDFGCKKESDLKAHMLVSHGVQEGTSREAEKGVSTESLIAYDEKLEHGYYCTVCKYSPSSMRYLRDHIRKVHLSKYIKCPHCELKTKRKADLMKHIKRLHPETGSDNAAASVAAAAAAAGIISPGGSGVVAQHQQQPQQAHQQHLQQQHHLQQQQQQHQLQQQQQRLQLQQQASALQQPPQQIQQTIQQLTQSIMSASGAGPPTQVPQQSVIPADLKTPLINLPQHPNQQHAAVAAAASAAAPAQPATDILLNAVKSEIPITLQLQYPAAAAAAAALPQFPAVPQMPQQPVQISLPTIDTSAILNTYTTPSTSSATLTVPSAQGQQQQQLHQQQQQAGHSSGNRSATAAGGTRTTTYKKGQNIEFDENTKVEDLIIYGSGPGQSGGAQSQPIGCSVCNYAPTSLRYLRDHIRKVHLAKTHKCTYCDLQTKRRADLVRHIQRIHEDPKRQQQQQQQQGANAFR